MNDKKKRRSSQEQEEFDEIYQAIYQELRRMARYYRSRQPNQTMSATDFVNEAYLKMRASPNTMTNDPLHFKHIAALAIRHIVIDTARERASPSHGGHIQFLSLTSTEVGTPAPDVHVLDLNRELDKLATSKPRVAEIVILRHYGGLSKEEIRSILGVSDSTIERDMQQGLAWLVDALGRHRKK